MSTPLDNVSTHHANMEEELEELIGSVRTRENGDALRELVTFLREEIVPHATGEEKHLYPEANELIREHGQNPTTTMSIDHEWIESTIENVTKRLEQHEGKDGGLPQELIDRLLQLKGVLSLHLDKEEEAFIPLLRAHLSEDEQQAIIDGLHEAYESEEPEELDVRDLPPRQRHKKIFNRYENLAGGSSFVLVNDHDPEPLYHQFEAEKGDEFYWSYRQKGPDAWKIEIGKQETRNE